MATTTRKKLSAILRRRKASRSRPAPRQSTASEPTAAQRMDELTEAQRALIRVMREGVEQIQKQAMEVSVTATSAREKFSVWISTVTFGGKRIVLKRHGKAVAAIVPVEDLNRIRLLELEDAMDLDAARESLKEAGKNTPLEEVKAELGL